MTTDSSLANSHEDQVFQRPLHLSGVLDNAADDLSRTFIGYDWNDRTRCNCGTVARQVLQVSAPQLKKLLPPIYEDGFFYQTWASLTGRYCPESGLSQNEVFRRLLSAGLQPGDFNHLEELSHPAILRRMESPRVGRKPVRRSHKADVIAYLRAWALGIEEFHDHQPARVAAVMSV
jgi:hypothetical protein